jgi:hypothetical protein
MEGWQLAVGLLILASGLGGAFVQLQDAGILDALERSRHRPDLAIIIVVELVALLAVTYLTITTARWAAVTWTVVAVLVAIVLNWTARKILRLLPPAPAPAAAEPQPAEPAAPGLRVPIKEPYVWVLDSSAAFRRARAAPVADGAPELRTYCGYEYDPSELDRRLRWTPQNNNALATCETCRAVLVKAGYVPY